MTATTAPAQTSQKPAKSKLPPPGATGTTTPGGIAAHDPAAITMEEATLSMLEDRLKELPAELAKNLSVKQRNAINSFAAARSVNAEVSYRDTEVIMAMLNQFSVSRETPAGESQLVSTGVHVPLAKIDRHPLNRHPTSVDVEARAVSLAADGQLEDCVVRMLGDRYQMISGETRLLAARKLKWPELSCKVIRCDDAEAARRVALHNAERADLNPIQKAQLIESLAAVGFTRDQAAKAVGLKTADAASNIVRLLELPEVWRQRVASGDLPQSFARSLLRVAEVPVIMDELEQEWQHHVEVQASGEVVYADAFRSRRELDDQITNLIDEHLQPLDGESYYNDHELPSHLRGRYKCLIDLEKHGESLGIVTIEGVGEEGTREARRYATNLDEFARLQREAIIAHAKQQKSQAAEAASESSDDSDEQENPTDPAEAARKRTEQLKRQIDEWADTLRRQMIATEFANRSAIDPQLAEIRLMLAMIAICELGGDFHYSPARHLAVAVSGKPDSHALGGNWKTICRAASRDDVAVTLDLMLSTMLTGNKELRRANFSPAVISDVFDRLDLKMQDAWQQAQQSTSGLLDHYAQFFELHRKSELIELARELGATSAANESLSKKEIVDWLVSTASPLPVSLGGKRAKKPASKTSPKKAKAK